MDPSGALCVLAVASGDLDGWFLCAIVDWTIVFGMFEVLVV